MTDQRKLLTVSQAAAYVGLGESTLNRYRVSGGGPQFLKLGGRRVFYDVADLDAWIAASRRRTTSEYRADPAKALLRRSITDIGLDTRCINALKNSWNTLVVADLLTLGERDILRTPNMGRVCLAQIKAALGVYGLKLSEKNRWR